VSNANKAYLECRRPASGRVDPTRLHVLEPHDTGAKALLVEISLGSKEKGVDGMRTISSFLASFLASFLPSFLLWKSFSQRTRSRGAHAHHDAIKAHGLGAHVVDENKHAPNVDVLGRDAPGL